MSPTDTEIVVIIPVFNDRLSCSQLLTHISKLKDAADWQVCLVDDGSICDAPEISDLAVAGLSGVILRLARNIGHQSAIACGIGYAAANWKSACVLIMDADGEDRPEDIPSLLAGLNRSAFDAVVAARGQRNERALFRSFYFLYKMAFNLLTGRTIQF